MSSFMYSVQNVTTNSTEYSVTIEELNWQQVLIRLPFTILIALTMTIGFVGNILTIYVYGFRLKLSPTYFFVVMLACTDLIICACVTPARIVQNIYPLMSTWDILCKFHLSLSVFTGLCNYGFLLAIATDRYRKVCQPLKYQITMKAAKIITACIFIFCATQGSIALLYYGSIKKPTIYPGMNSYSCSAKNYKKPNYYQLGFFALYFLLAVFTFVILVVLYGIILRRMKVMNKRKIAISQQNRNSIASLPCSDKGQQKWLDVPETVDSNRLSTSVSLDVVELSVTEISSKVSSDEISTVYTKNIAPRMTKLREADSERRAKEQAKRTKRTTITMMMITVVFIMTYLPCTATLIVNAVVKSLSSAPKAALFFYWFARHSFYISSCSNPIIYSCRNKNFIDEIKKIFGIKRK
ncbi:alpha-2 adrenergic receptor-like [Octopus sinensis]|uniref:Alpha-2 adrenergic receptor-like n=1 Tax=Octopus sinensis TaxID=2607531 RepID=A0A6P7SXS5_9MOLL|nr:alpha-2 adrenergic receptor-like [Octopus sinensis]XP_029642649.1 alpha-2 adrenergic receptor-like [Octopus sinensis]